MWSVPWPWKGHPEQMTQMIHKAEYCQHKGEKKHCDAFSLQFYVTNGSTKDRYNSRSKAEPWGMPQFNGRVDEQALPIETNCIRSLSYDLNQS